MLIIVKKNAYCFPEYNILFFFVCFQGFLFIFVVHLSNYDVTWYAFLCNNSLWGLLFLSSARSFFFKYCKFQPLCLESVFLFFL